MFRKKVQSENALFARIMHFCVNILQNALIMTILPNLSILLLLMICKPLVQLVLPKSQKKYHFYLISKCAQHLRVHQTKIDFYVIYSIFRDKYKHHFLRLKNFLSSPHPSYYTQMLLTISVLTH